MPPISRTKSPISTWLQTDSWGWSVSIQHFTWKDKAGKPQEATLRVTDVYHKVNGEWKIFHSHVSAPVDPKTGQGLMNLKS